MACITLIALVVFGCDSDDPKPNDPTPTMHIVNAPEFLLCELDSMYLYRVRIENLNDVEFVTCTITRPNGTGGLSIELYDDGNSSTHTGPAFASATSLDAAPNNGTFTRGVRSDLLCLEGEGNYQFHFVTMGGSQTLDLPNLEVQVRSLDECIFGNVIPITTLPACFDSQDITITVTPQEEFAIDSVRVLWTSGDSQFWTTQFTSGVNNQWSFTLEPSLFACTPTGSNYTMRYEAFTRFGLNCAINVSENISFTNSMPVLSNSQLPDTMYRPVAVGDSIVHEMFIDYDDCELAGVPQTVPVKFDVRREDLELWDVRAFFFLRDDGVPPDLMAGDGIASSYLNTTNNGRLDDLYYFRFYSIECSSGDTTDYLLDSTRIIQTVDEGGPFVIVPSDDLGISSFK